MRIFRWTHEMDEPSLMNVGARCERRQENNMVRAGETVRVVGISGSLRRASFSTSLLKVLAEKAAPAIDMQVVTLEDIPLYNEDLDQNPEIPSVAAFKKIIAES